VSDGPTRSDAPPPGPRILAGWQRLGCLAGVAAIGLLLLVVVGLALLSLLHRG